MLFSFINLLDGRNGLKVEESKESKQARKEISRTHTEGGMTR